MTSESDEMQVNYFVLCDQVITEAQTHKQSLIGVYSALMGEQFPLMANLAVGIGVRVQSPRQRQLTLRLTGPDNEMIFSSPPLPCAWDSVAAGLQQSGFATLQLGLNLRAVPFQRAGVYTAALFCDGSLLATYPISVLLAQPGQTAPGAPGPGVG